MSDIELNKSFQERIFEKIRDSIGELMTEEDLKKLVDATMQKAFFEPVVTYSTDWQNKQINSPPYIVTEITKLMKDQVGEAIKTWLKENPEEVVKLIDDKIKEGFTKMLGDQINYMLSNVMNQFGNNLKQSMGLQQ